MRHLLEHPNERAIPEAVPRFAGDTFDSDTLAIRRGEPVVLNRPTRVTDLSRPSTAAPTDRMPVDRQLFAGCTARQRRRIARMGTRIRRRPGDVLADEGEHTRQVLVVVEGVASALAGPHSPRFGAGDHIGGFEVRGRLPQPYTVLAATNVEIDVFDPSEFELLVDDFPSIRDSIARHAATL